MLTERQLATLETAKAEKETLGEFESERPGDLWSAGYLLRWHHEGGRAHLPTDLHQHLQQGDVRWTLGVFLDVAPSRQR